MLLSESEEYIANRQTVILAGDHIPVERPDGTVGIRWLAPGSYQPGEIIPEVPGILYE